jgi:hypothetical protein
MWLLYVVRSLWNTFVECVVCLYSMWRSRAAWSVVPCPIWGSTVWSQLKYSLCQHVNFISKFRECRFTVGWKKCWVQVFSISLSLFLFLHRALSTTFLSEPLQRQYGRRQVWIKSFNKYIQGLWQYKICVKKNIIICDSNARSCFGSIYVTAVIFAVASKFMVNINRND